MTTTQDWIVLGLAGIFIAVELASDVLSFVKRRLDNRRRSR